MYERRSVLHEAMWYVQSDSLRKKGEGILVSVSRVRERWREDMLEEHTKEIYAREVCIERREVSKGCIEVEYNGVWQDHIESQWPEEKMAI